MDEKTGNEDSFGPSSIGMSSRIVINQNSLTDTSITNYHKKPPNNGYPIAHASNSSRNRNS